MHEIFQVIVWLLLGLAEMDLTAGRIGLNWADDERIETDRKAGGGAGTAE